MINRERGQKYQIAVDMIRSFEKLDKIHAVNRQCFTKLSFDYENIQPTANKQSAICTPQLHAVYTSCRGPHCRRFSVFSSRTASPPRPAFPMFYGFPKASRFTSRPVPIRRRTAKPGRVPVRLPLPSRSRPPIRLFVRKPLS